MLASARNRFPLPSVELAGCGTKAAQLAERVVGDKLDLEPYVLAVWRRIQSCAHGPSVANARRLVKCT